MDKTGRQICSKCLEPKRENLSVRFVILRRGQGRIVQLDLCGSCLARGEWRRDEWKAEKRAA